MSVNVEMLTNVLPSGRLEDSFRSLPRNQTVDPMPLLTFLNSVRAVVPYQDVANENYIPEILKTFLKQDSVSLQKVRLPP